MNKFEPTPVSLYDLMDWLEKEYADPGQRWAQLRRLLDAQRAVHEAAADLAALRAERDALFQVAVLAARAVTSLAFAPSGLPGELPALDSYLANQLDDELWERIEAAAQPADEQG
jgi:hypothetical protein